MQTRQCFVIRQILITRVCEEWIWENRKHLRRIMFICRRMDRTYLSPQKKKAARARLCYSQEYFLCFACASTFAIIFVIFVVDEYNAMPELITETRGKLLQHRGVWKIGPEGIYFQYIPIIPWIIICSIIAGTGIFGYGHHEYLPVKSLYYHQRW